MRFMKWYSYLICVILIVASCFTTALFIRDVNHKSYVVGSSDFVLSLKKEGFSYDKTTLTFYRTESTNSYYFEGENLPGTDFDAASKKYEVVFNDVVIPSVEYSPGALSFKVSRAFYGTDGEELCDGTLTVSISFFSAETYLKVETPGGAHVAFFEKYFSEKGLHIKVNEIKEI